MGTAPSSLHLYEPAQARREAACLNQRRAEVRPPPIDSGSGDEQQALAAVCAAKGLALSGGGIRSATFNLGVLQAFAQAGRLKDIDFLSTVSGGGYIGSFLGRLYHRAALEAPGAAPAAAARNVEEILASDAAPILRWLRDHGRYLAPHGLKDRLFAYGIYFRNLLTIHVLLGVTLLTAFLGWAGLRIVLPALFEGSEDRFPFAYLPDGSGLSPAWIAALLFVAVTLALIWTYWMHRASAAMAWQQRIIAAALAALSAFTLQQRLPQYVSEITERLPGAMLLAAVVIGAGAVAASFVVGIGLDGNLAAIRNRISRWTRMILASLIACVLFALLDDAAYRAFIFFGKEDAQVNALIGAGLTGALLAGLRALAQAFAASLEGKLRKGPGRWASILIDAAGMLLLVLVAFGWAYTAEAFVWSGIAQGTVPTDPRPALGAALALLVLVTLAGSNLDVLNLSSLHNFYAARLARAYLGPGNPDRGIPWSPLPAHAAGELVPVSKVSAGDDIAWTDYAPHRHGGPLHLVNINVNQTRYSAGGDFQPDRKGWNLAVGPAGFNLGRSRWQPREWPGAEPLQLSQWVGISGAAFTTGAGPRTGLGFSALLGLLGVRLGFWWHAGATAKPMPVPHMLRALWHEITGAFNPDAGTHWYLSDGGHFENTAAYELIRRRIKRIVVADCGADPRYEFDDLANLARKIRIDFGAELHFFGKHDLDRYWSAVPDIRTLFAEPEAMTERHGPALLLATVRYPNDDVPGWMVVVKPRLPAQPPADLAHYAAREEDFPQQSTLEQFYDEAQWESHHKLGRLLGSQLVQGLAALPAWRDGAAPMPANFEGAAWPDRSATSSSVAAGDDAGNSASLVRIYAPLVIALWTGFEFYSNWKQDQAKEAAETAKFVLARIDVLERQVFGRDGCAAADDPFRTCPTIPAQTLFVKQLLANLPPSSAKPLSDVVAKIEEAVNVRKPQLSESVTLAAAKAAPPQSVEIKQGGRPDPAVGEDRSRALVYVHIYGEERRAEARRMIERLQRAGLQPNQLPGVENVVKTTQSSGAKPPARFDKPTAIYYHDEDKVLAEWIARQAVADETQTVELRDLSKSFPNVRKGLIELWLP
jgi:hypothetical protein